MLSKVIVLVILVLIGLLVVYLFHDSPFVKQMTDQGGKLEEKFKKHTKKKSVKIADRPVIFIKEPGTTSYQQIEMNHKVVSIGSGEKCDIVLDDETVEPLHVKVNKVFQGNDICYELINYSKNNPVEYLNQLDGVYEYLGYKKGIVLDANEAFYIGETKMIIKCPPKHHFAEKTERDMSFESVKLAEKEALQSTVSTQEEKHKANSITVLPTRTYSKKKSIRVVTDAELDMKA